MVKENVMKRREEILNFCLKTPRRFSEIEEEFNENSNTVDRDLKNLKNEGRIEKDLIDDNIVYFANLNNPEVQGSYFTELRKLWFEMKDRNMVDKNNDSTPHQKTTIDFTPRELKEFLVENKNNALVDERFADAYNPRNPSLDNRKRLLDFVSVITSHKDTDVKMRGDNGFKGEFEGDFFNCMMIENYEEFVSEVKKRRKYSEKDQHGRYKDFEEARECDLCENSSNKLYLLEQGRNSKSICVDCIKRYDLIESL